MLNKRTLPAIAALAASLGALGAPAQAQLTEAPAPAAYALQNVTLVHADGTTQPGVTIVVRRGFVAAIGTDVAPAPDARVLQGDSLFVYPGLVDGDGEADYEFPKVEFERDELAFWAPPRDAQGFMPHRRVADHLTALGSDVADQRKAGVVAAAVHPSGPLLPGRGSVLLFRASAETPAGLVLQPVLGPAMSLRGASGMFPSTLFGTAAVIRQGFEDARHHGLVLAAHQQDPQGMKAPAWDPDLDVLRDAMTGGVRVFFRADRALDIRTVLAMAEEYGFQPVIVGGAEAWRVAGELRERGVPVLVSLDFPEPERWDPDEEPDSAAADQEEELVPAAERERVRLENIYANAGRLAQAGVTFALTSGGGEAGLLEGARKAIEYGLTEQQALSALTATPAAMYGVEYLVRIAEGMPATFVVSDGPLFGDESAIRYTFVEGGLEAGREKREPAEEPAVDVTGVWDISIDAGEQSFGGTMTLTQDGAEFTGTMELDIGNVRISDGLVSGNEITFQIRYMDAGESATGEVEGTVEGDDAEGSGTSPDGRFTWTAKRTGMPGEAVR
jgi:hypothetical protein